ncbi:Piso0_002147 [Millerozyma farinosa CBS 7064]|uniref:Piso0_002147 protein n=1 Tax=Pichia sorbitophila (strain ATCC MYA-4447 / BCRC 22081 / CBS 7064 / NBRC 10061 / NRRL Y-12695) TaxID=559304 RepID=G8YBU0_PICSO|nr:Piso0_002147 [Millerozyma farinosa CBS 7064]
MVEWVRYEKNRSEDGGDTVATGGDSSSMRRKQYPDPVLFDRASTSGVYVPLFVSDIHRSQSVLDIYGSVGLRRHIENYFMINNFPVRNIKVRGTIVGESYKAVDSHLRDSRDFLVFTIDDYSGTTASTVQVKADAALCVKCRVPLIDLYGTIVEVKGFVREYFGTREVCAQDMRVLGSQDQIHLEIEFWKENLLVRNTILARSWCPDEQDALPSDILAVLEPVPKFEEMDGSKSSSPGLASSSQREEDASGGIPSGFVDQVLSAFEPSNQPHSYYNNDNKYHTDIIEVFESSRRTPCSDIYEFQLVLSFVRRLLDHGRRRPSLNLTDIYADNAVASTLNLVSENYIQSQKALLSPTEDIPTDKASIRSMVFHKIRHILSAKYKLIRVSKNLNVDSEKLISLADHLRHCLHVVKNRKVHHNETMRLNSVNYLKVYNDYNSGVGDIDVKLVNSILDYLISKTLGNREDWKYDSKRKEWSYIA